MPLNVLVSRYKSPLFHTEYVPEDKLPTLFLVRLAFVPLVMRLGFMHAKSEVTMDEIPPSNTTEVASLLKELQFTNSESLIVTLPFA